MPPTTQRIPPCTSSQDSTDLTPQRLKEIVIYLKGKRNKQILDVVAITTDGKEVPIRWRVENYGQVLTW